MTARRARSGATGLRSLTIELLCSGIVAMFDAFAESRRAAELISSSTRAAAACGSRKPRARSSCALSSRSSPARRIERAARSLACARQRSSRSSPAPTSCGCFLPRGSRSQPRRRARSVLPLVVIRRARESGGDAAAVDRRHRAVAANRVRELAPHVHRSRVRPARRTAPARARDLLPIGEPIGAV